MLPMSKRPTVVAGPPPGDIIMFIVENRYRGRYRSAPPTPYLLIVQAFTIERTMLMVRILGITKQGKNGLDPEYVPFVETDEHIEERLNEYFSIDWDRVDRHLERLADAAPVSDLIQ
jgi:hypothetical protein